MTLFRMMMVFAVALMSCSVASAQAPPQNPPNPCMVLQQQVNMCAGQCTAWDAIVTQKTASLASAQTGLANWQALLDQFWVGIDEQEGPMTPGQEMTLANLTQAINGARAFIRTTTTELQTAQQQLNLWKQALQQAQQAFNAAGC
jgi:flagellar biosynthesis chaperone FliJ